MKSLRWASACAMAALAASASGCVDVFGGVDIQLNLDEGVLGATAPGDDPAPGQPPPNTYFSLYAFDETGSGDEPSRTFAHELVRFEIVPMVDPSSPCFIELENLEAGTYVGLHVTQLVEKIKTETGISDPHNPPAGADEGDLIDIVTAEKRLSYVPQIAAQMHAVVATTIQRTPEVDTGCVGDGTDTSADLVPPPECIDDASNERRLALCQAFWDRNPNHYEGSDRSYTNPLNGVFYGIIDGINPKNSAGLGGVEFLLDVDWNGFEEIAINWQYEDADGDGEPDWPADLPPTERPALGFHYLEGRAIDVKRGATTFSLRNRTFSSIAGSATVLYDLGEDDVHF